MPHGIKIAGSGKEKDVPVSGRGRKIDWSFLDNPLKTLEKGEYLKIEVEKPYKITLIRKRLKKHFNPKKFSVRQRRQNSNLIHVYIVKEE